MFTRKCGPRNMVKTLWFLGLCVLPLLVGPTFSAAQDYPIKPITLHVGAQPGGTGGVTAQIFSEGARKYIPRSQPMIIQYRPGASYSIAADFVVKQPADGYNLLWTTADLLIKLAKDGHLLSFTKDDFIRMGGFGGVPGLLTVNKASPFIKLEDFINYAKLNPGKLSYGSVGVGSSTHLYSEFFQM